jgi:hypothetical protein
MGSADKLVLASHGSMEVFFLCLALPWERLLQRSGLQVAGTSKPHSWDYKLLACGCFLLDNTAGSVLIITLMYSIRALP